MMGKAFLNAVANGKVDILQVFLEILVETGAHYCVVGGLAVNAYAEPVVSLDLDIVVFSGDIDKVCKVAGAKGFKIARFDNRINLTSPKSDLRIQLQTDARYQPFIDGATQKEILGYRMNVAALEDVLQGKIWAYSDEQRRKSKKQKDLADIMRLVEAHPALEERLPPCDPNLVEIESSFDDAVDIGRSHFNALLQISETSLCPLERRIPFLSFFVLKLLGHPVRTGHVPAKQCPKSAHSKSKNFM
jgi:hypothetical protein